MHILTASSAKFLPIVLPLAVIALARLLTFSTWAENNAGIAATLFAWVVADALLLGLIARAPKNRPRLFQVIGVTSLASLVILLGAFAPLRQVYLSFPIVLITVGLTLGLFAAWSGMRVISAWASTGSLRTGFETVLPTQIVRLAISEWQVLRLGLFQWNAPIEIPTGNIGFAYHTYLTPMVGTILALQLIELSVVHLLLMLWIPAFAWIMLGLSLWGLVWTLALLKSFRIRPVLLTGRTVRVRSGILFDFDIPIECIADVGASFTQDEIDNRIVLDLAILSSPNVSLRLSKPIIIRTILGRSREIQGVALRLDDNAGFVAEVARRMQVCSK